MRLIPQDVDQKVSWQAGEEIELQISNIKNPLSFQLTDPFQIYISESTQQEFYVNYL